MRLGTMVPLCLSCQHLNCFPKQQSTSDSHFAELTHNSPRLCCAFLLQGWWVEKNKKHINIPLPPPEPDWIGHRRQCCTKSFIWMRHSAMQPLLWHCCFYSLEELEARQESLYVSRITFPGPTCLPARHFSPRAFKHSSSEQRPKRLNIELQLKSWVALSFGDKNLFHTVSCTWTISEHRAQDIVKLLQSLSTSMGTICARSTDLHW